MRARDGDDKVGEVAIGFDALGGAQFGAVEPNADGFQKEAAPKNYQRVIHQGNGATIGNSRHHAIHMRWGDAERRDGRRNEVAHWPLQRWREGSGKAQQFVSTTRIDRNNGAQVWLWQAR